MSALDSRGPLIHPDSPPRELMGGETAHSTHVTQRTDRRWGAADWESQGENTEGVVGSTWKREHGAAAVTTVIEGNLCKL